MNEQHIRQSANGMLNGSAALGFLGIVTGGMLLFGGMALVGYAVRRYDFCAIGVAACVGLTYGAYSFLRGPRR